MKSFKPPKHETTWGSKNAEDMFTIATRMAGFDGRELMIEIHKKSPHGAKVKESTVEDAMQIIVNRYEDPKERSERLRKEFAARRMAKACRDCLTGDGHYKKSCNTCESRLSQARDVVDEIIKSVDIETWEYADGKEKNYPVVGNLS